MSVRTTPAHEEERGGEANGSLRPPRSMEETFGVLERLAAEAFLGGGARAQPVSGSWAQRSVAPAGKLVEQPLEPELHLAEARYRTLVEQIPAVTFVVSLQRGMTEIYVSPQIEALLGFTQQEWTSNPILWFEQMHPDDRYKLSVQFVEACENGRPMREAVRMISRQGEVVWVHGEARFVWDEGGRPLFLQGVAFDITERKRSELALAQSEERFRIALASSAAGFSILRAVRDEGGRIVDFQWTYANPAVVRLIGDPGELVRDPPCKVVGCRLSDVLSDVWHTSPELFSVLVRVVETGQPADIEVPAESAGIDFWSRNIVAKLGDGVAAWTMDETERKRSQEALHETDRRKDIFIATLAHELRNPLAPIRQAAAISRMPTATEAQLRWSHEVIERQVQRMSLLLDDLLDISRITRGRLELRKTEVNLAAVIEAAVEPVQPLIEEYQHRLIVKRPAANLRIEADPLRLSQVLSNLLTNAAKYTDPGGSIQLTAEEEKDEIVIRVADSGIGISAQAMPRIFEMFSQVRSAMDRSGGGLGIGLALSRGLIELHGGSIAVRSEGPGRGSEFTIRLPAARAERQADASASRPAPRACALPLRVLVADDNRDAADSLAMLVELHGCEQRTAFDGEQALEIAASFHPQIALLDIGMPKLNGYEVAARLREQARSKSLTLIAVTGWGQEEDKRRSAAAGFDHHLTKPIDPAALGSLLGRIRTH